MASVGQAWVLELPRAPLSSRAGSGPPVRSPIDRPARSSRPRLWRTETPSAGQDGGTKRPASAPRTREAERNGLGAEL